MTAATPAQAVAHWWHQGRQAAAAGQWPKAAAAFDRAAGQSPRDALIWMNLARARLRLGQVDAATAAARKAHALQPRDALTARILAECLVQHRHAEEAVEVFAALPPEARQDHDLLVAWGNALFAARRPREAVDVLFQALALRMDSPLAHHRLGLAFKDLGLAQEASECFRTVLALDQGSLRAIALSLLVYQARQACDWERADADAQTLLQALDHEPDAVGEQLSPFALLSLPATPAQQRRAGALRTQGLTRGVEPLPPAPARRPGPVRVGYLSSDFGQHATAVLLAEVLELRDRERFEVFLYSHSADDGSALQQRVFAAADHVLDVTHLDNDSVARRMRDDGIDIAVDLKGHTRDSRFEILARRPAPVQMGWLGYPGTTGADFIDYLIGDPVVTPLAHAGHYSERIAQLPHSYQPNDRRRPLPPAPARSQLGLPADAVVLCCFNQSYKIGPEMLDLWVRILQGVPKGVLWMLSWNPTAEANLRAEFARRGVGPERLVFADKRPLGEHITRLRAADLFLDTWPCNAHTTASEALWAGVPVITVPGDTFASRVAASLVSACGLAELACADADAYVALATALANEPDTLGGLKVHLDTQRLALPLFDTPRFVRGYESLLLRAFERAEAGRPPEALPAVA